MTCGTGSGANGYVKSQFGSMSPANTFNDSEGVQRFFEYLITDASFGPVMLQAKIGTGDGTGGSSATPDNDDQVFEHLVVDSNTYLRSTATTQTVGGSYRTWRWPAPSLPSSGSITADVAFE